MGNGHAMPQTGRAQSFAGKQAVGHQGPGQAVQVLKQQPGFFKSALFTGGFKTDKDLGDRKDGG